MARNVDAVISMTNGLWVLFGNNTITPTVRVRMVFHNYPEITTEKLRDGKSIYTLTLLQLLFSGFWTEFTSIVFVFLCKSFVGVDIVEKHQSYIDMACAHFFTQSSIWRARFPYITQMCHTYHKVWRMESSLESTRRMRRNVAWDTLLEKEKGRWISY